MSKFVGQTTAQPRSRSTSSRHYSNSSYSSHPGPSQTTTSRTFTSHSMTYSALPKPHEPPVNSVEYYQMQQLYGNPFTNIQQAAAPPHIQHTPTGFGGLRDRYKSGSLSEEFTRPQPIQRQQQQQPRQRQASTDGGSTLSSLRNQYMNRTKETSQDELPTQQAYNISRTIVGEDIIEQKRTQQPPLQMQPPPQVLQKQQQSAPQAPPQQQQAFEQEQSQAQDENIDQQASSSEVAPPSADDTNTNEPPSSSY